MNAWYEDEAFWEEFEPVLFSASRLEKAPADVDAVLALTGREGGGGDVLDLCCGVGRHSLEFARRGFRVTAVDRNGRYLATAREREAAARSAGAELAVEWVREDMRRFRREGAFDLAVSLFTSFGYFDDPADDLLVARNLAASLRPGGHAVIDVHGKEVLARAWRERDWISVDGEGGRLTVLEERTVSEDFDRVTSAWTLVRGDAVVARSQLTLRLYAATELQRLLREAGFRRVRTCGDLTGRPYDTTATRLVAVAER